jgi:hypothetical protein
MRPVHATLFARLRVISAAYGLFLAIFAAPALAAAPTTTTLSVGPSNNVTIGQVATLTAAVMNPSPVIRGTVMFCNALIVHCGPGRGLYGTATLTSAGTAVLRTRLGAGIANVQALFIGTSANAASTSLTNAIAVAGSPIYASSTTLNASGSAGSYTLSGTVTAFGGSSFPGALTFVDTSNSNAAVGLASLNTATSSLTTRVAYTAGNNPIFIAEGDFNGDGIPDLAVADAGAGTLSILIGNGDGTFRSQVAYATGNDPQSVAVGDFNGDGIPDLAVTNAQGNTVSTFIGNGDGTFKVQVPYATGVGPIGVTVGDFNGDGIPDLAIGNQASNTVSILIGNGDGTFKTQVAYAAGAGSQWVGVGDFNGDGIMDLAVTNETANTVSIFIGNGDGTFKTQVPYATGATPQVVTVADFNGDGIPDLAVADETAATVSILIGNGDGTFKTQVAYATGAYPYTVAVGDFNGDGVPDLAVANPGASTVSIIIGNNDGTFKTQVAYATGSTPIAVAVGDFNGDGVPDIATANDSAGNTVSVLLSIQTASYSASGVAIPGSGTHNVLASYAGDASRTGSQSATVPLTATMVTATMTVSCSPNPVSFGQTSTCTANAGTGPTGTVAFTWNGNYWATPTLSGGTASLGGVAGLAAGTYTVSAVYSGDSNYNSTSASTILTISPAPSVLMWSAGNQFESTASLSLAPVTAGNANGVTAQVYRANSPTGTLAFANGATNYGTLPLQSVSTTNLVLQSSGMSSGWAVNAQVLTSNAGQAPDGTNTAASLVSNGGDNQFYQVVSTGNISGQTFTSSIWVKGVGSAVGKNGRIWVFPSDYSVTPGCDVPITANWARVSCTVPYGAGYTETTMLARYDLPRYGEAAGDTVLVWGPQFESSASVGPYVPTTTAAATMSQPVAVAGSYVTSPGGYTVTAAYSGDGSNAAASGSVALTAVAATPLSVISVSPTTTPYGSPVSLSALISTGGDAPTGTVNFASDGSNVATAAPTSATTENYIPYSRDFTQWQTEAIPPTVQAGTVLGPNGVAGDVATVTFPVSTGSYSGIRYVQSGTGLVGKTMTFSFWVRGDVASSIGYYLVDWPYTGTFAPRNTCNVTTVWQQCSITGTWPSVANNGFYLPIRSENQSSPIKIYLWGPQLEQASTPGPYVSTAGAARTASGGVATGSVSTLAVGTHAMTAAVSADANVAAAASAAVSEVITDETPTMSVSCSPNPATYSAGSSPIASCVATLTGGGTGTVTFNGVWTVPVVGTTATLTGFNTMGAQTLPLTAVYSGDADHSTATASTTLTISKATPTVSLSCSPNPITYGSQVTSCTTTVVGGATGSLTWTINGGAWTTSTLSAGSSSTGLGDGTVAGSQTIAVTYSGDSNFSGGSASTVLTITQAPQTISFAPLASPVNYGVSPISLSATGGSSGNPIAFSVASGPASASGSTLTIDSANGNHPYRMTSQGSDLYITTQGGSGNSKLAIVDISNPGSPTLASLTTGLSTSMNGIGIQGTSLFVTYYGNSEIQSWNVQNPRAPVAISALSVCSNPYGGMVINGNYAYVPCPNMGGTGQISIVNISNPAAMSVVGTVTAMTGTNPTSLSVQNNVLYMINPSEPSQSYVSAYSLANPAAPTLLGQAQVAHSPQYLTANGTTVLTTAGDSGGIQSINFSNPSSPVVSSPTGPCVSYTENTIFYSGNYALVSCNSTGFYLVNTSNPAALSVVGSIGSWITDPTQILVVGQDVYVGSEAASTLSVFSWASPTLMQTSAFGSTGTLTITGAGTVVVTSSQAGNANYSAATPVQETIVVNQAPTVTELSSSANPVTFGASTTFTALVDTGAGTPTGSVAFTSNGSAIGSGTLSTVTTTNLEKFSTAASSWSYVSDAIALNSTTAPDGTNTATLATISAAGGYYDYDGNISCSPGPVTYSLWLKNYSASPIGQVSLALRFFSSIGTDLMDNAISVVPTANWQRYSETDTAPAGTTSCAITVETYNLSGPEFPSGAGVYMWGAQVEQASAAGPYIATSGTSVTGNGGIATLTTSTLPVGSDSIAATFSGDANTLMSTSNALIEMVTAPTPQSISLTALPSPQTYGYNGNYIGPLVATGGGSGNPVVFTVLSGPGSITGGNMLYSTGVGTIVVAANQAGNSSYLAAPQVTQSVVVTQAGQTITIYGMAAVTYGVGAVNLSTTAMASASSGLPITYSVVSGPGTVSGTTLTVTGGGNIVIAANQAGNAYYLAAQQVTTTLQVLPASQTVTVGTYPSSITYGTTHTITLTGTASSGLPVTFQLLSGPGTLSGNTLTITGAGTIWLDGYQAGNASYSAGVSPNFTITVSQATPTLSVASSGSPSAYGASVTFTATITSGATGNIQFFDGATQIGQSAIVGTTATTTVSTLSVGSHSIAATYPNYYGSNYTAATSSPIVQIVSQQPQSITFAGLEATSTVGPWPIELSATASSNLPVTFRVVSGPGTVSGDTLTVTGVGTIVVGADQAGNSQYAPALEVTQSTTGTAAAPASGILAVVPGQITTTDGIVNSAGPQLANGAVSSATYLNPISGVAIALNGDRYFTNLADQAVWKVSASTGILTQVAGCQLGGPSCSWLGGPNQSAPALQTSLNGAGGLVMDGDHNAYFTDMSSAAYKLNLETGTLTEIGSQFDDPTTAIAVDSNGNVYVGDDINIVWKYTAQTQAWSIFAGQNGSDGNSGDGGLATAALIGNPSGLAMDSLGNLYISDNEYNVIRKVSPTGIISTIAGTTVSGYSGDGGPATAAQIGFVYNMTTDPSGILYFADATYNVVRQIVPSTGIISTIAGNGSPSYSGDGGSAKLAGLNSPAFMSIDSNGNLYVVDQSLSVIRKLATSPGYLSLGSVSFGSSSPPTSILIENRGLQGVLFSANPSITGDFNVATGNTCGNANTTLAVGATCSIPVVFTPTASGTRTGTLTLADNGVSTSQSVNLSGTGLDVTPSISVSCSPNPITYGSQTTACTTTVGNGATGSVVWAINGTAWTTNTLSGGTASAGGFAGYSADSYTIAVTYQGDADHNPASASTTLTISKTPLTITPNAASRTYGAANPVFTGSITGMLAGDGITATYASAATATTVAGVYSSGANAISSTLSDPNGKLGNYTVTQNVGTLTITQAMPAVTLTSPSNPATYGTSITFTAQTASLATGTMSFLDGATLLGTGTISGGVVTFTTNTLSSGSHSLTASYPGDTNYSAAVSPVVAQVITKTSATMSITSSKNPSNYGDVVIFTVTAAGLVGLPNPSGSVTVSDGSTVLAVVALNGSGVATDTVQTLTAGSHSLSAVYGGDANYK